MRITSSKKGDILKRKREYEARMNLYEADKRDRETRYRNAEADVLEPVEEEIMALLSKYNLLEFRVDASRDYVYGEDYKDSKQFIRVRIECNNYNHRDHALSWRIDLKMDYEGNLIKETGSWSGLEATSMDNIKELRQTVDALEEINTMDWTPLMTRALPKFSDYYEGAIERPETQNFNQELAEAELEELIGQNKLIKIHGWGESYAANYYYAAVKGQTGSQWRLAVIPAYYVENAMSDREDKQEWVDRVKAMANDYEPIRARKSSITPVKDRDTGNFTIVDLDKI